MYITYILNCIQLECVFAKIYKDVSTTNQQQQKKCSITESLESEQVNYGHAYCTSYATSKTKQCVY